MAKLDWLKTSITVVRSNLRAYIVLNALYYGVVAVAMIVVASNPGVQAALTQAVVTSFTVGPLSTVFDAYAGGNVLLAILLTFTVNFFLGSVLVLFIPSLLILFQITFGLLQQMLVLFDLFCQSIVLDLSFLQLIGRDSILFQEVPDNLCFHSQVFQNYAVRSNL